MKNIFQGWEKIQLRIKQADSTLILFDFDGTLSEIVRDPKRASLDSKIKNLIRELQKKEGVMVGIISGRSLSDIKKKVGLKKMIYGGNHGMELDGPGLRYRHPGIRKTRIGLKKLLLTLQPYTQPVKGLFVDDKGLTVSLHFRNVAPNNRPRLAFLKRKAIELASPQGFEFHSGKKVFELRPAFEWNKGSLVAWLEKKKKHPLVIYVGDDRTDEDAFHVVQKRGFAVRVGKKTTSKASYYLKNQRMVSPFIKRLVQLWN